MANTLDDTEILMIDRWPRAAIINGPGPFKGPVTPATGTPTGGGIAAGGDHNVAIPGHEVGTKWFSKQDTGSGQPMGWSTWIYLRMGTQSASVAAKSLCALETEPSSSTAGSLLYTVTNLASSANYATGLVAYAIGAMTDTYYGWFWCGGVAPTVVCPSLGGTYVTYNTEVVVGYMVAYSDTVLKLGTYLAASAIVPIGICLPATDT
jgi:hypothetical protein